MEATREGVMNEMEKSRGCLTEELKKKAEQYLGREFTQDELRLYPYLCYCSLNDARIERAKTTPEEQDIIHMLESEGRLQREYPSYMHPTREFWVFMNECLADSYVILAEDL